MFWFCSAASSPIFVGCLASWIYIDSLNSWCSSHCPRIRIWAAKECLGYYGFKGCSRRPAAPWDAGCVWRCKGRRCSTGIAAASSTRTFWVTSMATVQTNENSEEIYCNSSYLYKFSVLSMPLRSVCFWGCSGLSPSSELPDKAGDKSLLPQPLSPLLQRVNYKAPSVIWNNINKLLIVWLLPTSREFTPKVLFFFLFKVEQYCHFCHMVNGHSSFDCIFWIWVSFDLFPSSLCFGMSSLPPGSQITAFF